VEKHGSGVPRPVHNCPSTEFLPKRLTEWHFPQHIPAARKVKPLKKKKKKKRRGIHSYSKCSECEAGLYVYLDGCFKTYHSNLYF
jgi:hypothetical protein